MITDEFECVLAAAMRYSLGRQTYMPSVVVGYITPLISELSDKFLYVAMRDIDEQRERGEKALGNPTVDKPVWDDFYKKIKIEYERRKNNEERNKTLSVLWQESKDNYGYNSSFYSS